LGLLQIHSASTEKQSENVKPLDNVQFKGQAETSLHTVSASMPHVYRAACSIPLNAYRTSNSIWGFVCVVDWNMWASVNWHS